MVGVYPQPMHVGFDLVFKVVDIANMTFYIFLYVF